MSWMWRLTGGRPMRRVRYEFIDCVGSHVYSFMDRTGRFWLATSKWGFFRVRMDGPHAMEALANRRRSLTKQDD